MNVGSIAPSRVDLQRLSNEPLGAGGHGKPLVLYKEGLRPDKIIAATELLDKPPRPDFSCVGRGQGLLYGDIGILFGNARCTSVMEIDVLTALPPARDQRSKVTITYNDFSSPPRGHSRPFLKHNDRTVATPIQSSTEVEITDSPNAGPVLPT